MRNDKVSIKANQGLREGGHSVPTRTIEMERNKTPTTSLSKATQVRVLIGYKGIIHRQNQLSTYQVVHGSSLCHLLPNASILTSC
jgi:hypothetical protein